MRDSGPAEIGDKYVCKIPRNSISSREISQVLICLNQCVIDAVLRSNPVFSEKILKVAEGVYRCYFPEKLDFHLFLRSLCVL